MDNLLQIGVMVGFFILAMLVIGLIVMKLYKRATKETSFVRTGAGGEKVVKDGGAIIFPVLHETINVNMQTLRLPVERKKQDALITKDRLRVDVAAEFYVRVRPDAQGIATAAQTLGQRTQDPQVLRELVEGKFVDALRSVAAKMEMQELHENRATFVQEVQTTVAEDLSKNGLELESVSLTGLDQTPTEFFDPNNAFDAQGLAKLVGITEDRRRQRNDTEQNTKVAIEQKNLETNRQSLELQREQEFAQMELERETANRRAEQKRLIAEQQSEQQRASEVARITAERATNEAKISADREIAQKRIEMEREIEALEIDKQRSLREREIERDKVLEQQNINRDKAVKLAQQDEQIAVAKKSEENSMAQAAAAVARAQTVSAEEAVITARETAIAQRQKDVAVLKASEDAEREAVGIKVAAAAEKSAAEDRASAAITEAEADAKTITIRAEAKKIDFEVESEGRRKLNEAENSLSDEIINLRFRTKVVENMAGIMAEIAKPMQSINGVKVHIISGLGNGGAFSGDGNQPTGLTTDGGLPNQITDALLGYRMKSPLVDELGKMVGMDLSNGMSSIADNALSIGKKAVPAAEEQPRPSRNRA